MNFCKIEEDGDAKSSRRDEIEGLEDITNRDGNHGCMEMYRQDQDFLYMR